MSTHVEVTIAVIGIMKAKWWRLCCWMGVTPSVQIVFIHLKVTMAIIRFRRQCGAPIAGLNQPYLFSSYLLM